MMTYCMCSLKSNKLLTKPIQCTKKYKCNTTVLNLSLLNPTNNIGHISVSSVCECMGV